MSLSKFSKSLNADYFPSSFQLISFTTAAFSTYTETDSLLVVSAIPRSDIFGKLDAARQRSIAVSVGVSVAMGVLASGIFFLLVLPLFRLARSMQVLTKLDFSQLESSGMLDERSWIWELYNVQTTFATMVRAFAGAIKKNKQMMGRGAPMGGRASVGGNSGSNSGGKWAGCAGLWVMGSKCRCSFDVQIKLYKHKAVHFRICYLNTFIHLFLSASNVYISRPIAQYILLPRMLPGMFLLNFKQGWFVPDLAERPKYSIHRTNLCRHRNPTWNYGMNFGKLDDFIFTKLFRKACCGATNKINPKNENQQEWSVIEVFLLHDGRFKLTPLGALKSGAVDSSANRAPRKSLIVRSCHGKAVPPSNLTFRTLKIVPIYIQKAPWNLPIVDVWGACRSGSRVWTSQKPVIHIQSQTGISCILEILNLCHACAFIILSSHRSSTDTHRTTVVEHCSRSLLTSRLTRRFKLTRQILSQTTSVITADHFVKLQPAATLKNAPFPHELNNKSESKSRVAEFFDLRRKRMILNLTPWIKTPVIKTFYRIFFGRTCPMCVWKISRPSPKSLVA